SAACQAPNLQRAPSIMRNLLLENLSGRGPARIAALGLRNSLGSCRSTTELRPQTPFFQDLALFWLLHKAQASRFLNEPFSSRNARVYERRCPPMCTSGARRSRA